MKSLICSPFTLRRSGVLGMNRRNLRYIAELNSRKDYPAADDKLLTKTLAKQHGIAVPDLYGVFRFTGELRDLSQKTEPLESFVVKPSRGSGGEGVLVIDRKEQQTFFASGDQPISLYDLRFQCAGILHGLYSLGGRPDKVILEEKVIFDSVFERLTVSGVPDVRLIVLRGVPVMAMVRLPTRASHGCANLHQGAIGVGVNIATGITTSGVHGSTIVTHHPDTGQGFCDLALPHWNELLSIAARCYDFSSLGYLGADIVYDKYKGPLLLEINARPGLAIQLANREGLKRRIVHVNSLIGTSKPGLEERIAISASLI